VQPFSSLSGGCNFPCSAEMQHALIFWLLHPLAQYVVGMLRPVCFCAVEDGRYGRPDLRREGSSCIVAVIPVAVEVWMSSWWNDRGHVGSERGSRAPVHCARSRLSHRREWVPWLGPRSSPSFQRAPRVPRARRKYAEGVRLFDDVMEARARRKLPLEAPISPETSPQGSGGMEVDFRASSD
jgi:hypothetical protein